MTITQLLKQVADDKWCYFGVNVVDYTLWNLHLNLCCAWNSHEVLEMVNKSYKIVFEKEFEDEYEPDSNEEKEMYAKFSKKVIEFCAEKHGGVSVSVLLNKHFSKHVKKCRGSFYDSKYEERIRLIYCMVWYMLTPETDITQACVEYLFTKVCSADLKFSKCFVDMYNEFGNSILRNFKPLKKRSSTKRRRDDQASGDSTSEETSRAQKSRLDNATDEDKQGYSNVSLGGGMRDWIDNQQNIDEEGSRIWCEGCKYYYCSCT